MGRRLDLIETTTAASLRTRQNRRDRRGENGRTWREICPSRGTAIQMNLSVLLRGIQQAMAI
jgi:hypothetical protein